VGGGQDHRVSYERPATNVDPGAGARGPSIQSCVPRPGRGICFHSMYDEGFRARQASPVIFYKMCTRCEVREAEST
jgi:hypothetical protein